MNESHGSPGTPVHAPALGGKHSFRAVEGLLAALVIAGCVLLLLGNLLSAQFYLVEDHHLLGIRPWTIGSWLERIQLDIVEFQRFRPLYWSYVAAGASWFGRNPLVWHFFALLWGALSLFLFYRTARRLGCSVVAAIMFVAVLGFSSNQSWVWINCIPQETLGVALLSLSAWAFVMAPGSRHKRLCDVSGFTGLALAGLSKESFVLVIPAMLMLRLVRERQVTQAPWPQCLVRLKALVLAGAVMFAVGMAVVVGIMLSNPNGYSANAAGVSLSSFNPLRWWEQISRLGLALPLGIALVLLVVQLIRMPEHRGELLGAALTVIAWVAPQLVLYSHGIDERYLFPAVIGISAAITFGFSIVPRGLFCAPQLLILALVLPVVVDGSRWANKTANWLTAETISANRMVTFLAENLPTDKVVVIAANPDTGYGYEALYSLPIYLKLAGGRAKTYGWPLESRGTQGYSQAGAMVRSARGDLAPPPSSVGAIVLIDTFTLGLKTEPIAHWMIGSQWKELSFSESYRYLSQRGLFQAESAKVSHKVLVPEVASGSRSHAIVSIDPGLGSNVVVSPVINGPPWGLEDDYSGPGKIAWLGHGDAQGLGGVITSAATREVTLTVEAVIGPSRPDYARTVELALGEGAGQRVIRREFSGGIWEFKAQLQEGENPFRIRVLDAPTVKELPNGDKRTLMALVRRITISK